MTLAKVDRAAAAHALYRDSLHDVASNFFLASIVEPRGARIGMAEEVLNVLERNPLIE